jgi:hypothetical protein
MRPLTLIFITVLAFVVDGSVVYSFNLPAIVFVWTRFLAPGLHG